eukprot:TRINITY_DN31107_c0_g1_i1.p1 TRINITY_DN31107_c0_g1~~TRINITY_DN31107_c0_g1_i1.p1  ORF type:complete len:352 (+),score=50.25 TRINITY_DN31107_c0_g1_i1:55-1056(+)
MEFSPREWVHTTPHEKMPAYDALRDPHLKGLQKGGRLRKHIKRVRAQEERARADPEKAARLAKIRNVHAAYGAIGSARARKKETPSKRSSEPAAAQELKMIQSVPTEDRKDASPPPSEAQSDAESNEYSSDSYIQEGSPPSEKGETHPEEMQSQPPRPPVDHKKWIENIRDAIPPDYGKKGLNKPVCVADCLYLGDAKGAKNTRYLQEIGVKRVFNCAPSQTRTSSDTYEGTDISYEEIGAEDAEGYPLLEKHLHQAKASLTSARSDSSPMLIHCFQGVNRSAALVVACIMSLDGVGLLDAVRSVHALRPVILQGNDGFLRQLVDCADGLGLL